jgi:valyl-tRNA synthetase
VDSEGQRIRLRKEIAELDKLILAKDSQLGNEKFLNGAPAHVVDSLRSKRAEYVAQRDKSQAALSDLK